MTAPITSTTAQNSVTESAKHQDINVLLRVPEAMREMEKAISELTRIMTEEFKTDSDVANKFQDLANQVQASYSDMKNTDKKSLADLLSKPVRDKIINLCALYDIKLDDKAIKADQDYDKGQMQALYQSLSYKSQAYVTDQNRDQAEISSTFQTYTNTRNIVSSMYTRWSSLMNSFAKKFKRTRLKRLTGRTNFRKSPTDFGIFSIVGHLL